MPKKHTALRGKRTANFKKTLDFSAKSRYNKRDRAARMRKSGYGFTHSFFIFSVGKDLIFYVRQQIPLDGRATRKTEGEVLGPLHHFPFGRRTLQHHRPDLHRECE